MTRSAALDWSDTDARTVDLIRVLAMDAVERAGSGHPGTAMSLAPAAYLLYQKVLRHDPADPLWPGRDRFVLSCGHSSLTLYIQLYLSGYGLTLDDLEHYRVWGSKTPGHPEHHLTAGVETTTGPLGQGIGNAVGMAMAARRERGLLDREAEPGSSPFDHYIYCFVSDGDMEEGISHEAASLAGHQQLGNLIVLYDDNNISIEDDTNIAKSEDVAARYEAYGWHVQRLSWLQADGYHEDVQALYDALETARATTTAPSFISLRTIIAWPAPHAQNTGAAHGAALGAQEVAATKRSSASTPPSRSRARTSLSRTRAKSPTAASRRTPPGTSSSPRGRSAHPQQRELFDRLSAHRLPAGWTDVLPDFPADEKGVATRKASGEVLNALAPVLPELWGGSADLAGSNDTTMKGEPSFVPEIHQTKMFPGNRFGRTLHFGIREHAMGSILNGIALHGLTRPYGGTFLVFSDYMRPSVRLAALMGLPVTYVWTHDSIGLGEDGPTHQPVEHLWALRAIPGLDVVRPADANEVTVAWRTILERTDHPAGLCLSRQNLPVFDRFRAGGRRLASAEGTAKGGYVLADADGAQPDVILIGTGSEVQLALAPGSCSPATASRPGSCPCPASSGTSSRTRPTATRCCRRTSRQGSAWRRGSPSAGGSSSATLAAASAWNTSARRRTIRSCTQSSASRPTAWREAARDSLADVRPGEMNR